MEDVSALLFHGVTATSQLALADVVDALERIVVRQTTEGGEPLQRNSSNGNGTTASTEPPLQRNYLGTATTAPTELEARALAALTKLTLDVRATEAAAAFARGVTRCLLGEGYLEEAEKDLTHAIDLQYETKLPTVWFVR